MNYTFEASEKSTVKLVINFTGEEWKSAIDQAYLRTRGKYAVPGFRKGKCPKPVIENYYGKAVFFDDAFNVLYSEHYPVIIEKESANFTAVGAPELSVDELTDEKVVLTAIVPVKPEVKIGSYKGLEIKKYEYNVTEEEIKTEADKILLREAKTVEVTDRACKSGDTVNIDFSGSVDGELFAGGSMEHYDLELGSGSFIPGFEDQVAGMKIGEEKDIKVTFPADYQADNLKGKEATFHIKLHAIKGKELPELTDEYVKKHAGSETVAAYMARVKERLENKAKNDSRDQTENSILQAICATCECEIPQAMIDSEVDNIVQDFAQRLAYQGLQLKDYIQYMGQTMEQFRAQFAEQARSRVLTQLVIEKIIKDENITATQEEIEAKIAEQAASVEKSVDDYKKTLDSRRMEYIANDIVITKLFDFLSANNKLVA
ncbi:MAG: trigger factor [Clostridia bacterium]|nr:trigger factor [Clostridia bacterium]